MSRILKIDAEKYLGHTFVNYRKCQILLGPQPSNITQLYIYRGKYLGFKY